MGARRNPEWHKDEHAVVASPILSRAANDIKSAVLRGEMWYSFCTQLPQRLDASGNGNLFEINLHCNALEVIQAETSRGCTGKLWQANTA